MICASSEIPQTQRRSFLRPPMQLQPWQAPEMVSLEGVRETEKENRLKCPPLPARRNSSEPSCSARRSNSRPLCSARRDKACVFSVGAAAVCALHTRIEAFRLASEYQLTAYQLALFGRQPCNAAAPSSWTMTKHGST